MTPDNLLFLTLKDRPALAEMLKTMGPGDELDLTLTNGTGTVKGKFCIDELLSDRVSGHVDDVEVSGVEVPEVEEEDDEDEKEPPAPGAIGASVLGVMAAAKKS